MGGHISLEAGRANVAFTESFEGLLKSLHIFMSLSYAKTFFGYH